MFNDERKSAFLSDVLESAASRKLMENMFILLQRFELKYEKDFSEFSMDELKDTVPHVGGIRFESAEVILSNLKKYTKWCAQSGFSVDDSIFSYEVDTSARTRSCFVRSPDHLLCVLDYVFQNTSSNSIEYIYRAYLWLAYFGFEEKEAARVMTYDVDFDRMLIRCPNGVDQWRQIYDESVNDLHMACSLESFYEVKRSQRTVQRAYGSELLRGKETSKSIEESLCTTFRQTVSKYFKSAEERLEGSAYVHQDLLSINLSYKRILLSGMFYRAHQGEQLGIKADFSQIAEERYGRNKSSGTHTEQQSGKMKYHMKRGYIEDYENWKRAFEL